MKSALLLAGIFHTFLLTNLMENVLSFLMLGSKLFHRLIYFKAVKQIECQILFEVDLSTEKTWMEL